MDMVVLSPFNNEQTSRIKTGRTCTYVCVFKLLGRFLFGPLNQMSKSFLDENLEVLAVWQDNVFFFYDHWLVFIGANENVCIVKRMLSTVDVGKINMVCRKNKIFQFSGHIRAIGYLRETFAGQSRHGRVRKKSYSDISIDERFDKKKDNIFKKRSGTRF